MTQAHDDAVAHADAASADAAADGKHKIAHALTAMRNAIGAAKHQKDTNGDFAAQVSSTHGIFTAANNLIEAAAQEGIPPAKQEKAKQMFHHIGKVLLAS